REELALLRDRYEFAAMLIVCPSAYRDRHAHFVSKFDAIITYEEAAAWLAARASAVADMETARRLRFRSELLTQAADKGRRGYTAILNPVIGSFNRRYTELLEDIAPEIIPGKSMLKDSNPDESVSMIF